MQLFTARRSYANAVLGVVILSVYHTCALWLIQRTYRRYFYTTWTGNPSSQMWFFIQLCSSWQDFNWLKTSRGPSALAELLVIARNCDHAAKQGVRFSLQCYHLANENKIRDNSKLTYSLRALEINTSSGDRFDKFILWRWIFLTVSLA